MVDVGCGAGDWISSCEGLADIEHFCGVDISITALRKAMKNTHNSDFILADAQHLPIGESTVDTVTCLGSLEHFPSLDAGLGEMSRIMTAQGRAFILLPNAYFLGHVYLVYKTGEPPDEGEQQFSERFATKGQWRRSLERNGFQIIDCLKHNHITEASTKVSPVVRQMYNLLIAPLMPLNLSYVFIFICRRCSPNSSIRQDKAENL